VPDKASGIFKAGTVFSYQKRLQICGLFSPKPKKENFVKCLVARAYLDDLA
jgi:hypothetical protein